MEAFSLTPTGLQNIIFFLLPGFIFISLFFHQIPDKKKSDFIIVLVSVVISAVLNNLTNLLLNLFINILHVSKDINFYSLCSQTLSLLFAVIFAIFAAKMVQSENKLFRFINKKLFGVTQYPFGTLWNGFLKMKPKSVVRIFLENDSSYIGQLGRVSNNPDDVIPEIELLQPYVYDKVNSKVKRIKETERMLIQGSSITSIEKIIDEEAKKLYKI
ncbi:MAG TPA: DUF6338 family protein [Candidatus Saccharimonadales bacterium]|nr:DUF6338 family protein [Candidatus Saccharimonadales bacterium]